ncbi:MAG: hypothetical protein M9894_23215 [Planctomycetes bacterium]|nr:hypothetical protein [Planctomycetota bacterium]
MSKPAMVLLLAVLALAAPARADTVILRDGRKLQGEVTWSDDKKRLEVRTRLGSIVVDGADVVRVIIEETPEQELLRRRAALAPDDLAGRVALAEFCIEHRLERDAAALLLEVLAPRPDEDEAEAPAPEAELARRAAAGLLAARLDYHLVDGRWVPPEEYYPARGFVRHRGRWVRREQVELVQQLEATEEGLKQRRVEVRRAERALDPARRGVSDADAGLRKVERALANLAAEKAGAERTLQAREADVQAARERVERARRNLALFGAAGAGDERAQAQLLALQHDLIAREAELDRALRAADQVRAAVDELARLEATGPQVRAEAQAAQARAREALAAAEQALAAARAAVEQGAHEAESLKQRLEAMKRAGE